MSKLTLKGIEDLLVDGNYDCVIIGEAEDSLVERLRVYLGVDTEGGECVLDIIIREDLLGDPRLYREDVDPPKFLKIEFQAILDWMVADLAMEQTSSLLHFINRSIDLPGFELNELDGRVGYRYVHLAPAEQDDYPLIRALIGSIKLFIDIFGGVIREVAQGNKTFDDILDVIIDHVREMGLGEESDESK